MILENLRAKARKGTRETIEALKVYNAGNDVDVIRRAIAPLQEVATFLDYSKYNEGMSQGAFIAIVLINNALSKVAGTLNGLEELYPLSEFLDDPTIEKIYQGGVDLDKAILIDTLEGVLLMIEEITNPPTPNETTH